MYMNTTNNEQKIPQTPEKKTNRTLSRHTHDTLALRLSGGCAPCPERGGLPVLHALGVGPADPPLGVGPADPPLPPGPRVAPPRRGLEAADPPPPLPPGPRVACPRRGLEAAEPPLRGLEPAGLARPPRICVLRATSQPHPRIKTRGQLFRAAGDSGIGKMEVGKNTIGGALRSVRAYLQLLFCISTAALLLSAYNPQLHIPLAVSALCKWWFRWRCK